MYGKPHLNTNAYIFTLSRTGEAMGIMATAPELNEHQQHLARQCRDLALALHASLKEFSNG